MIPFWLPIGHVLTYGERRMRFEEALGDGILRFRYIDGNEEIVLVPVGKGAALGLPTVKWIIAQFRAGVVTDRGYNAHVTDRNEGHLHLDREACLTIDKKTGWRFDWADAAITDGIIKTEDHAKAWIKANNHGGKKPKPRSLLRWMHKLLLHGRRIGALVSTAGRLKGQSQLSDIEDRLVHKWALHYWRPGSLNGFLAHKDDAAAMMVSEWDILNEMGIPGLGDDAPSSETVRKRINDLEGYSTYASRYGTPAANRKFRASGEPVPIERPFERMYMDGVEWEHSVFYSDEYKIPVAKMRSVITMDGFSQWVAPHPTFAGEFRPQWGLASLRAAMLPPPMTEEEIAEDPERALFYGILADVMYDRDRTMISPRMVPGTIKVVSTAELAQAWHHDAKSKLENYHKFVKQALSKIPGRILGARVKHDIGYNPLKETFVTRAQYVDLIEQCRLQWNSTPKTSLGNRSPDDIMRDFIRSGANRLADPNEVRRTFASTPAKKCQLNKNGLIYDKVHYRHAREDISKALSANYHKTSFARRIESGATIDVSIRVWDDDLDMIEVFDEARMDYFPMWSTDPGYTGGLNRWEHEIYQKALASMPGRTKRDRLRNKATYLDKRQRSLTGLAFRERREPTEMLEAEERRMSGRRGKNPACAQVPELHVPTVVDGGKREDIPTPPPQTREEEQARREPRLGSTQDAGAAEGAGDVRSDPSKAIARELGDDEAIIQPARPDWNMNDVDDDADEAEED